MNSFIFIIVCIAAGIIIGKLKILPENAYKGVNGWVIYIALPALVLRYIPGIEWNITQLLPAFAALMVWFGAWIFVSLLSRKVVMNHATKTALIITSGLGNTSFLGYPMITAFYGEDKIQDALVFDQVTFLIFSTLAVFIVMKATNGDTAKVDYRQILKKIFTFPSFIAAIVAIVFSIRIDFSPLYPFLDKLVVTVSPLALFSIGLQFKISDWKKELPYLTIGISYKLLIAPLLVFLLMLGAGLQGTLPKVTVFEAAMSSHISGSLLATQYNLNPKLCSLMVGITIVGSLITTVLWYFLNGIFF